MGLTKKQIYDLNNMNVAAQRSKLGNVIDEVLREGGGGGGGSGETSLIQRDSYLLFPNVGDSECLYIDTGANTIYRWDSAGLKYYMIGTNEVNIVNNVIETLATELQIISGGNANG